MDYSKFCFCTLGLGVEYRLAAWILAKDIEKFMPSAKLLVLTDANDFFKDCDNVIPVKFSSDSPLGCYHDKRFALSQALLRYENCCYLDADSRIFGALTIDLDKLPNAIHVWHSTPLAAKFEIEGNIEKKKEKTGINTVPRRLNLIKRMNNELSVNIDAVQFITEALFIVSRNSKGADTFLKTWDIYARKLQIRGYDWGEGETIGTVAEYCGWQVKKIDVSDWLFNDMLTKDNKTDQIENFHRDRKMIHKLARKRAPRIVSLSKMAYKYLALTLGRNKYLLTVAK